MVALGIIGIILLLVLAGVGAIYTSQWSASTGLPLPSGKPPVNITPEPNETRTNITGDPAKDFGREIGGIPWVSIWDVIFSGIGGIVIWFGKIFGLLVTYIGRVVTCVNGCNPAFEAPWWAGWAFVAVLTALFIMQGIGKLFDVGHKATTWVIIVSILLLVFGLLFALVIK